MTVTGTYGDTHKTEFWLKFGNFQYQEKRTRTISRLKEQQGDHLHKLRWQYLVAGLACLFLILAFVLVSRHPMYQHYFCFEQIEFEIPSCEYSLRHSRRGSSPIMAEYERWLQVFGPNGNSHWLKMKCDTAGGYPIDCYLVSGNGTKFVFMKDKYARHLIDLDLAKAYQIVNLDGKEYLGPVSSERRAPQSSIYVSDGTDTSVTINGSPAVPMNTMLLSLDGTFIGQITDSFGDLRFQPSDKTDGSEDKNK